MRPRTRASCSSHASSDLDNGTALESLVLVGDIEQSIYAFQGASPGGCQALIERAGLRTTPLTENHRSSQRICDVAACFCLREAPDEAVGPDGECDLVPELFFYDSQEPAELASIFGERLDDLGLNQSACALLARGGELVRELNAESNAAEVAERPALLGHAVAATRGSGTLTRRQVEALERIVSLGAWGVDPAGL